MTKDRFLRIVDEIKRGIVKNSKDRKDFSRLVNDYILKEDKERFLFFRGREVKINSEKLFDEFVNFYLSNLVETNLSKKEAILENKSSKRGSIHSNENIIIHRKKYKDPIIYYKKFPKTKSKVVVVENFESFLELDFSLFDEEDFIYLGGFSNRLVREFLKDKEVIFFMDFDFFGIEIYNSIVCREKTFFIPKNLEELLFKFGSTELYKRQLFKRDNLKVDNNTKTVFKLINKYSKCLEQEILNVN